ncbi:hypothetical protein [Paenibacillus oceani]|uniref:Uncharacterized protein n=1 Tax=Paenibacillus oceani TaxID=2772510 RepID=A0A927C678_9BACL|nr:hypothetical protein [Paenibacillus oceani]MBD2860752.1 hypothetical protein [Paenibacillus oceani]
MSETGTIQAAATIAAADGGATIFPAGKYRTTPALSVPSNLSVTRNVKVYTKIENPDDSNYEWGFLSEFDNYANLAVAAVSRKFGTGMTWAFYSDIVDATDNPTTTTVNSERNIHSFHRRSRS